MTNLTDSSGAVVKTYSYDAFGVEESPSDSDANPFRYCGEYYDSEIEQIYLRARYYDPSLGRFTQQDPAMADGMNWYVYCGNNPVLYVDPLGLNSKPKEEDYPDSTKYYEALKEYYRSNGPKAPVWSDYPDETKFRQACISFEAQIGTTTNPISIIQNGDNITIYAYVNISGSAANSIVEYSDGKTYKQAAIDGIVKYWSGIFNDNPVYVTVIDVNSYYAKNGQRSLDITLNSGNGVSHLSGWIDPTVPGSIMMYQGDSRNNYVYTWDDFSRTVAHEFGHALGIADLYNDDGIKYKFPSIMNSQWQVDGAQSIDYAMMLKAYRTDRWQIWSKNKRLLREYGIRYY